LNNPDNGRVIYGGTVIGQTAFFSCDAGYSLIGATVITCQLDGSWNNPPPSCAITGTVILLKPYSLASFFGYMKKNANHY
jgi:CUB/sushi domain-containing protein